MAIALKLYNQLITAGLTHAGALGLLGNWMAESGLEANRLQGDFTADRSPSRAYTDDVTAGRIPRAQFARDQKGYGLAQWTYFNFSTGQGRKLDLYDFWTASGKALDDPSMQTDYALHELETEAQYAMLLRFLKTSDDLYQATEKVCRIYEQPYFNNVDARYRYAKDLEAEIRKEEEAEQAEPEAKDTALVRPQWPPRTVDRGMSGSDVTVLQAVLIARGYACETDGTVGQKTDRAIRAYQKAARLTVDGVCGPKTWKALLSLVS